MTHSTALVSASCSKNFINKHTMIMKLLKTFMKAHSFRRLMWQLRVYWHLFIYFVILHLSYTHKKYNDLWIYDLYSRIFINVVRTVYGHVSIFSGVYKNNFKHHCDRAARKYVKQNPRWSHRVSYRRLCVEFVILKMYYSKSSILLCATA